MKCIAAVVMMTLAIAAEANVIALRTPVVYTGAEKTVVQQNVAPKYYTPSVAYNTPVVTAYTVPETYVQQKYYSGPAVTYAAAPAVTTYSVPKTTYVASNVAPAVAYSTPVVTAYTVPEKTVVQQNVAPKYVSYTAPAVSYVAPAVSYSAPAVTYTATAPVTKYESVAPVAYPAPIAYSSDSDVVEAAPVAAVAPEETVVVAQPAVAAVVAQKEARYVAANPGAVHEAPLAGHTINQQSLNVQPAPGTQ